MDDFVVLDEIRVGDLIARRVSDDMSWGDGAIQPLPTFASRESQQALLSSVLESIEQISDAEADASACTDGRRPVRLLDDQPVPVRKQLVGGNLVSAFYAAEALADAFYKDPAAPVADRINHVADYLVQNGIRPSGHVGCGAGAGFAAITGNVPRFAQDRQFIERTQLLLPDGVYDEGLHQQMLQANQERLGQNRYEGLDPQVFLDAIERTSGKHAIAELNDDGRGVHGHVEEDIVRMRVGNRALNEAKLVDATEGREVFAVNDDAMDDLATLLAQGNEQSYKIARMALEDFANAGHGTLAKGLSTWVVTTA